jgi:hypothetical protein
LVRVRRSDGDDIGFFSIVRICGVSETGGKLYRSQTRMVPAISSDHPGAGAMWTA